RVRGRDSSRRTRTLHQGFLGKAKHVHRLFTRDGGEVLQKRVQRLARSQVIDEVLHRDARAGKNGSTPQDLRVPAQYVRIGLHASTSVPPTYPRIRPGLPPDSDP